VKPVILKFGIPSLDELLNLAKEPDSVPSAEGESRRKERSVESYAIVGADGSGKSVLALHMASRYHADCWARTKNDDELRTPRILYVSSDLRFGSALKVWKNFSLHHPNTRHVPFERTPDAMQRYWIERKVGYNRLCLQPIRPSNELDGSSSLIQYLLPPPGKDDPQIGFLDLATYTAGDDWNFVNALLAKLESIPTVNDVNGSLLPHLVIVDSVLGFETFVGRLDAYGTEQTRRARIAQCMRNAGTHCHLLFVVEEPNENEHLPEEYVTDVVLRLRQRKRGEGITRTLEIEKARARNHAGGEHPFEVRSKQGSSTRGWENADMPVARNDYVHVLHSIPHRSGLVARYEGVDLPDLPPAPFGIPYLDEILGKGLSVGTCNALIADASTGKSALAERFLADGFRALICQFIRVYARFHELVLPDQLFQSERSWDWLLKQLRATVAPRLHDERPEVPGGVAPGASQERPPERGDPLPAVAWDPAEAQATEDSPEAVRAAIAECEQQSVLLLKNSEYPPDRYPWIEEWADPKKRNELKDYLKARVEHPKVYEEDPDEHPKTRTEMIFAISTREFNPKGGAAAILDLFNHPNLRRPAVLLTTSNKQAREVAIDCLVHHRTLIEQELNFCFGNKGTQVWLDLEKSLIAFVERQIVVRRFDIVDEPAAVVLHVIIRNLLEAKKLIFGPFFPTSQERHKVKAERIRLVIDDLRVLCNTSPDVLRDSTFLSFLTFQLERSAITSLLVYSDAVRPDTRPADETSRALLSLAKRSILIWRVPFEGHSRFALTLVPPAYAERSEAIRELKLIQPTWKLNGKIGSKAPFILVPAVTPKFELYSGVEKGEPSPVPLAVYLYAETKQFATYVEEENSLFREMFTSVEPASAANPGRVIFPLDWTRYLAMRDYTHLSLDKLDNHTMIFQVDGSWATSGGGALSKQKDYLEQRFSADEDERSAQDPFHLFKGDEARKTERRHYFENSHYRFKYERTDRVPFTWDFGFVLARSAPWLAAFALPFCGKLELGKVKRITPELRDLARAIVPFSDQKDSVKNPENQIGTAFGYLSNPQTDSPLKNGGVSWRKFFGACRLVADIHRAQTGAQAIAFDISASSPETMNSLILEIWFSEILLEQRLRDAARGDKKEPAAGLLAGPLEHTLLGDSPKDTKIRRLFEDFRANYREYVTEIFDRRLRGTAGEGDAATPVEKMRMFERRNVDGEAEAATQKVNDLFESLPLGAFCLYKTWLLLLEVLDFKDYFDPQDGFTFRMGRTASLQAVASRHWYKTACSFSADLYDAEGIHDGMVPFRLPGSFSTRGDWFLGSPSTSRSRLLARHAFDLLGSRRANLSRLQRGLGLPVRDVVLNPRECGNLRTALRCRLEEVERDDNGDPKIVVRSTQMPYRRLAELGSCEDLNTHCKPDFRWLWRHRIEDYDRQSRVLQKWTARIFRWTIELRERLADDWQGGFAGYDHMTCRRFAEVYEYPSFLEFADHCDLLVAELTASARNPH
jgi:KaiC/GvpD/RAD55 family RecA-like ATPase